MAYYDSSFYEPGFGEYYTTPPTFATTYDVVPFQDSVSYSNDEFSEPEFYEHCPTSYSSSAYYDPFPSHLEINHYSTAYPSSSDYHPFPSHSHLEINRSMYRVSEPLLIEYNPELYEHCSTSYGSSAYYDSFPSHLEINHYPTSYPSSSAYDPFPSHLEINRSMYRVSEPLLIEYDPISSYTNYRFSPDTHYTISYSTATAEIDDTHYEEYDLTPYDGGYDPTMTYGKPLSPSTETCYPRSSPVSGNALSPPDKVAYGLIPSPYGRYDIEEPPAKPSVVVAEPPIKPTIEKKQVVVPVPEPEPEPDKGDGDSEDESDISIQPENEPDSRAGYGYGVGVIEQAATRVPYGYGLEAMDLCETLFGYWPCLDKQKRMNNGNQGGVGNGEEDEQEKIWSCAADYLFGTPGGGGNYWEPPTYNYERHFQTENHIQVENSWLLNSTHYLESQSSSSSW